MAGRPAVKGRVAASRAAGVISARLMSRPPVFLGLGSNLGDREDHLVRGLSALRARGVEIARTSCVYLTEPVGGPEQDWFLNAVAVGETPLSAEELLAACLAVEQEEER